MNNEKPLFSIIVPVYNEEDYIHEALDSILSQTDPDWEAILVDDGSTDSTPGIIDEYARKDNRFRVFHKTNGGTSSAINKGVQEARGEWICWLSGDDLFHPQKLEKHRRWMQEYPGVHFFFTGFWLLQPDGKKIEYPLDWLNLENPDHHVITLFRANYVIGISVCIERETWLQNGPVDESLRYAQDFDMWLRLMLNTTAKYLPDRTCTVRYHPGQDTSQFPMAPAFEASKVIIRTLNNYSFSELFPGVDLQDKSRAIDMLSRTIDYIACEPASNVYGLGIHPLLHFRMLEWLWSSSINPMLRKELLNIIIDRASKLIHLHSNSAFGLLWQTTRAALKINRPCFAYFPCDAEKVGEVNYYVQQAERSEIAQPLHAYLEKADDVSFDEIPMDVGKTGRLVLILPPDISLDDSLSPEFKRFRIIWRYLTQAGFFVVLVGKSKYTMGLVDGLLYVGAETVHEQDQLLAALGDLDTVVSLSHSERLKLVTAERLISFEIPPKIGSESELSAAIISKIQSAPRKRITPPVAVRIFRLARAIYHFLIPDSIRLRLYNVKFQYLHGIGPSGRDKIIYLMGVIYRFIIPLSVRIKLRVGERLKSASTVNISSVKKQEVIFIAYALWGGGVEKVLYELAHGIDPEQFVATVVYLHEEHNLIPYDTRVKKIFLQPTVDDFNAVPLVPAVLEKEGEVIGTADTNQERYTIEDALAEVWPFALALRRVLKMFSKDAIFIPMDERNTVILWLSQLSSSRRVLASQHYPYSQAQQIRFPTEQMRRVKEVLYLNACQAANAVTFDSEGSRWDFINNFGASPKRTLFMPNPVNCASIINKSRQPLSDKLRRLNRRTIFTQVARMAYEKNPLLLIDACDILRKKYDDFVVFYIGDGPLFNEMSEQINKKDLHDHILLLGEQSNPYPYVANARALLLTSRAESSPLVLVESMLCGAVPVATDCVAGPRELLRDGKLGLLVRPNDPEAFAQAMYQIAIDDVLHDRLRKDASKWARRFDTPNVIREWERLILYVQEGRIDDWVIEKKGEN